MIWPFKKQKKSIDDLQTILSRANSIVFDFNDYALDSNLGLNFRDISALKIPKDEIISAFRLILNFTEPGEKRELIKIVGMQLAQFQPGVGSKDVRPMPDLESNLHEMPTEEMMKKMDDFYFEHKTYLLIESKAAEERSVLLRLFEESEKK